MTENVKRKKSIYRQLANTLTIFRIVIGLPVLLVLSIGFKWIAWILILLAAISDVADGFLARKAGGGTIWGARLDPLADKILIIAPLIWLASHEVIPTWTLWLLISRELIISTWRSSNSKGGPASLSGKIKTILQFTSILLMLWPDNWSGNSLTFILNRAGWYLFWPSLFFAIYSAFNYLRPQSRYHQN